MERSRRHLFGSVVIDPDQPRPVVAAVVPNGAFLPNQLEPVVAE